MEQTVNIFAGQPSKAATLYKPIPLLRKVHNYHLSVIFAQTAVENCTNSSRKLHKQRRKKQTLAVKINLNNDKTPFSFNIDCSNKPNGRQPCAAGYKPR